MTKGGVTEMGRSIGLQSSRMCQEEVRQFLDCQKTNSFGARVGGICNGLRVILDECLDNESVVRRKKNADEAKERWERYVKLRDSQEPFVFPELTKGNNPETR